MITKKGVFGIVQGHQNRDLVIDPKTGALFVGVGSSGLNRWAAYRREDERSWKLVKISALFPSFKRLAQNSQRSIPILQNRPVGLRL
jgi:hypothetical protein